MLHIYYAEMKENNNIDIEIFPDIIKDYLLKKKNQKVFNSSIFSWYCLDLIVKKHYHKNLKELDFYFTKNGKPAVRAFYFNISHSIDFCAVAISNKKIGIDVEKVRKIDNIENMVDKLFWCLPLNNKDLLINFFIGFTQYEALIKYNGETVGYPKRQLMIRKDVETNLIEYNNNLYVLSYKGCEKAKISEIII
ncbi:MAG: 4'-phosphopantetheinyl transferase family protein [Bacilli bacterium]|jgi:holo-[acyl-carrier-protein] synthase|nr:hypothetical protein [Staphylococcus sp.]